MLLKTLTLKLESDKQIQEHSYKLRGFFATKFNEYVLLHQHQADRFIYSYPLIQYKMIDKMPRIIGINEGVEVLKEIYDGYDSIKLGEHEYKIFQREIVIKEHEFGVSDKFKKYQFLTPWFALNQENFENYLKLDFEKKKEKLRKIMIGNIISMSKGLKYTVDKEIKLDTKLRQICSSFKGRKITAFKGEFIVNFNIPDLLGIGKSVSRGFGTVKKIQ
jgi:hypothetical protein